ncbi:DUF928 domain-containing protein [Nostoc sp. 'Peltigera malacea cyanobiont' DB3992]|uniref:DUF928 domain-containing protein n=1 Tax=Nostoc sp. 'Peltigera malacea cyanobiont' DB3992 TaxID=1206980 RepID=UPI00118158C1|nr:DUF928 domain-containing protein [Nostoc sp. 'Peltigera malacea cyanobiont' DB3992]
MLNYLGLAYKDLGKIPQAQTAITESINIIKNLKNLDTKSSLLLAQALNTQGTLQLLQGQTDTAINTWKQAAVTYERTGDKTGKLISQINQAQGLQTLGQYRRAKTLLEELVTELQNQPDSLLKAQGLRSLGIALQTVGDLKQSKTILDKSWKISKQFNSPTDVSAVLFSIGNVARDLQQYDVAWIYYQQAVNLASEAQAKLEAQLNQLSLLVKVQNWESAQVLIPEIETNRLKAAIANKSFPTFNQQELASSPVELATKYAEVGVWYDTLKILAAAKRSQPNNKAFATEWHDLLKQVGLENIASQPLIEAF